MKTDPLSAGLAALDAEWTELMKQFDLLEADFIRKVKPLVLRKKQLEKERTRLVKRIQNHKGRRGRVSLLN